MRITLANNNHSGNTMKSEWMNSNRIGMQIENSPINIKRIH